MANKTVLKLAILGGALSPHAFGSSDEESDFALDSKDELRRAAMRIKGMKSKPSTKKRKLPNLLDMDGKTIEAAQSRVFELIRESTGRPNYEFATALVGIKRETEEQLKIDLKSTRQTGKEWEKSFAMKWKKVVNAVLKLTPTEAGIVTDIEGNEHEVETTLLNILLRSNAFELKEKFTTLLEHGASKNLLPRFDSELMRNQREIPVSIILEIEDRELREDLLSVLLDHSVQYTHNDILDDNEKNGSAIEDIYRNRNAILRLQINERNYDLFEQFVNFIEQENRWITEPLTDAQVVIHNQIKCDPLEYTLQLMADVRQSSITTDAKRRHMDNINQFLNSEFLMEEFRNQSVMEDRFGEPFQAALEEDYEEEFIKAAKTIDDAKKKHRKKAQIEGRELKGKVLDWVKLANFRNRLAKHLNRFALASANKVEESNLIKLIRYAEVYKEERGVVSRDARIFKELHVWDGKNIIFTGQNRFGWTPLSHAMIQKHADAVMLYLNKTEVRLADYTDALDNGLSHLAFPLPEHLTKKGVSASGSEDVLEMVGALVTDEDAHGKTKKAVSGILDNEKISDEDKIEQLRSPNSKGLTPVALAAASGYYDVYEYLQNWMLLHPGSYHRDDHSYMGETIEQIAIAGLERLLAAMDGDKVESTERGKSDDLTAEGKDVKPEVKKRAEIEKILADLKAEAADIEKRSWGPYDTKINKYVRAKDYLLNIAKDVITKYNNTKAKRRKGNPYAIALSKVTNEILFHDNQVNQPKTIEKEVWDERTVSKGFKEDRQPRKGFWGKILPKKKVKVEQTGIQKYNHRTVTDTEDHWVDHPLSGLEVSLSDVKATYLHHVVEYLTETFMNSKGDLEMRVMDVYQKLTDKTPDYFRKKFSPKVEAKMRHTIEQTLKNGGKLIEERSTRKERDRTIFDDMESKVGDAYGFGDVGDEESDDEAI